MKALIAYNDDLDKYVVVDIVESEFEVHESLTWMDCPDGCVVGEWELINGSLQAIPEPEDTSPYFEKRRLEYPPIVDQLDDIFHNGIDGWKASIQVVKDKYPKGSN